MITQQRVRELFAYKEGSLIRKIATSNRVKVGDIAGTPDSNAMLWDLANEAGI